MEERRRETKRGARSKYIRENEPLATDVYDVELEEAVCACQCSRRGSHPRSYVSSVMHDLVSPLIRVTTSLKSEHR